MNIIIFHIDFHFFYVLCIFRTGSCAIDFLALNNYKLKFPTHFQFFYLAPKNFRSESQLHMIRPYIRGIFFVKCPSSSWYFILAQWNSAIPTMNHLNFHQCISVKELSATFMKIRFATLYFLNCFVHYFGFLSNNCIVEILSVLSRSNPGPDGLY